MTAVARLLSPGAARGPRQQLQVAVSINVGHEELGCVESEGDATHHLTRRRIHPRIAPPPTYSSTPAVAPAPLGGIGGCGSCGSQEDP